MLGLFKKKKAPIAVSEDDRKIILGMIWCLKPSDYDTLAEMQKLAAENPAENFYFSTPRTSSHGIFWTKLASLGLAQDTGPAIHEKSKEFKEASPEQKANLKSLVQFSPTVQGRRLLFSLLQPAIEQWPPQGSIISPEAIEMLRKGATAGSAPSQSKLAYLYDNGIGLPNDVDTALKWYHVAAAQGDKTALNNLGLIYLMRKGITNNPDESVKYFTKAAEKGSISAMDNLGEMYGKGLGGISQDLTEAFKWFHMAAEHDHPLAKFKTGEFYRLGLSGPPDPLRAYIWYSIAFAAGIELAGQQRDLVAKSLTAEQIIEADLFVGQWQPISGTPDNP